MEATLQSAELVKILASNIRARRLERGISQQALADAANVSQPYIAQLERGIRSPGVELLAPLADALATTPDALLTPNVFSAV